MTPEHEAHARFVDDLVRIVVEERGLLLEKRGSATWKRRALARGVEVDACYYVAKARHVIGKRTIDLDVDPPPDPVVGSTSPTSHLENVRPMPRSACLRSGDTMVRTCPSTGLVEREYRPLPDSLSFPD